MYDTVFLSVILYLVLQMLEKGNRSVRRKLISLVTVEQVVRLIVQCPAV